MPSGRNTWTPPGVSAPRLYKRWRQWAEARSGVTTVEFALVAIPFFFLIFGLLEIALLFIMSTVLEHSVAEASRSLRTGQFQKANLTQQDFKNQVCDELFGLLSCDAKLTVDVKTFSSFSTSANPSPIDEDGEFDNTGFAFAPGSGDQIVVVRVFYEWKLITPILSAPLANMSGGRRLLSAVVVFRNEPWGSLP